MASRKDWKKTKEIHWSDEKHQDFNEIGLNQISTSIPLRYELNRTIVGVCADGDYCVVGGN